MNILAFDTSAPHCAAALLQDGHITVQRREAMARGQAERLMVLLEDVLNEGALGWSDLDAIAVGIGPGNFTGIRIAVSAARGAALGTGIPAIGVDRFEVIAHSFGDTGLPCVSAPQDRVYLRAAGAAPRLISRDEAEGLGKTLIFEPEGFNPAPAIAQIAAGRIGDAPMRPAPLYIKAADAAPARDAPPRIIP